MSDGASPVQTVEARTHGRYVVRVPRVPGPWPLVMGFHGYAETAGDHMDALQTIPGTDEWLLVSVQALHPFYTRKERVVASWMTRDDRELAIADNIDYVGRVLDRLRADHPVQGPRRARRDVRVQRRTRVDRCLSQCRRAHPRITPRYASLSVRSAAGCCMTSCSTLSAPISFAVT
jgi:hypothetical protein